MATYTVSCPWSNWPTLFISEKLLHTQIWITVHCLSVILLIFMCFVKKQNSDFSSHYSKQVFSLKTSIACSRSALLPPSYFVIQDKRYVAEGWGLTKVIIFTTSLRIFLSASSVFPCVCIIAVKVAVTTKLGLVWLPC